MRNTLKVALTVCVAMVMGALGSIAPDAVEETQKASRGKNSSNEDITTVHETGSTYALIASSAKGSPPQDVHLASMMPIWVTHPIALSHIDSHCNPLAIPTDVRSFWCADPSPPLSSTM